MQDKEKNYLFPENAGEIGECAIGLCVRKFYLS